MKPKPQSQEKEVILKPEIGAKAPIPGKRGDS